MKNNLYEIFKKFSTIQMETGRKLGIRQKLQTLIKAGYSTDARRKTDPSNWYLFSAHKKFYFSSALILFILIAATSTSALAQNSLPGDLLYPVKVQINEPAMAIFTFGSEDKVLFYSQLAAKRLEETEALAALHILDEDKSQYLGSQLEKQTSAASSKIESLRVAGKWESAANLSSYLEAILLAHNNILSKLFQQEIDQQNGNNPDYPQATSSPGTIFGPFLDSVKINSSAISTLRAQAESEVSAQSQTQVAAAVNDRRAAAKLEIDQLESMLRAWGQQGGQSALDTASQLQAAKQAFDSAQDNLEAGSYGSAFSNFQQSLRLSQQAKLQAEADEKFNLGQAVKGSMSPEQENNTNKEAGGKGQEH